MGEQLAVVLVAVKATAVAGPFSSERTHAWPGLSLLLPLFRRGSSSVNTFYMRSHSIFSSRFRYNFELLDPMHVAMELSFFSFSFFHATARESGK